MAINLACVPVIWFLYPETKRRPLESIKTLFGERNASISSAESHDVVVEDGNRKGDHGQIKTTEL